MQDVTEHASQSSSSDAEASSDGSEVSSQAGDLAFPASYAIALTQLLITSSAQHPVPVKELLLETKDEKLGLVSTLWEEGYICTCAPVAEAAKAESKSKAKRQKR